MKPLKKLSAIAVLVLVLGFPVYAGDMDMPRYPPPPPPPPPTAVLEASSNSASANINTPDFTEVALDLLFGAISVF